ncbi:MAG: autotransporter-associated beta strand repeat-containing protein, partial [Verrucomicrobia bacterium]|nr:autotransporter-associated beta strand repeat-containing protein [Verrucomicrobiota bacterium]
MRPNHSESKNPLPRHALFALLLAAMAFAANTHAASATWNGTVDATWAGANWSASPVPGTGDTATFNGAGNGNTTIDLGAGVAVGSIFFDTASAAAYTVGSGAVGSQTLTLDDTALVAMSSTVANHQLVNANIVLGTAVTGTTTFTNGAAAKTLTFAGNIDGGTGGTAGTKTLNLNGSGTNILQGAINKGGGTAINVANIGTGISILSGSGTSALGTLRATAGGTMTVNGQTITVASSSQYGGSTALGKFILNSGSAAFNGGIQSGTSSGALAGADGMAFIVNGGTFSASAVALGRSQSLNTTFYTAAASLTSGFLVNNNSTASVTGTVNIEGSNSSADGQVSGTASLTVGGELRIAGRGGNSRVTLFQVTGGTLTVSDATAGISIGRGTAADAGKGQLLLTGGTTTTEKITFGLNGGLAGSSGNLTVNDVSAALYIGSGGIVLAANNAYTYTNNLMAGTLGAKAGWASALNMGLNGSGVTIKAADASDVARNITLTGALTGANGFTKTGGGTLTLAGANTYTGNTLISAGTVQVGNGGVTGNLGAADAAGITNNGTLAF